MRKGYYLVNRCYFDKSLISCYNINIGWRKEVNYPPLCYKEDIVKEQDFCYRKHPKPSEGWDD